jgi:hypothetical protein
MVHLLEGSRESLSMTVVCAASLAHYSLRLPRQSLPALIASQAVRRYRANFEIVSDLNVGRQERATYRAALRDIHARRSLMLP